MDEAGDFVEQANVFGNLYGTSREEIRRSINNGNDLILEIDWQGAKSIKAIFPEAISRPPCKKVAFFQCLLTKV